MKKQMNVLFRVDSSRQIGLGHLMRCIAIANVLSLKNINCIFLFSNKNSIDFLKNKNHQIIIIEKNENEILVIKKINLKTKIDFLIIDSKRKSVENLVSKLNSQIKIVLIDRMIKQDVFLTILPGMKEQFLKSKKNSLVGSDYVLIPHTNSKKPRNVEKNTILLLMGGGDKLGITEKILKSFKKSNNKFKMTICIGKFYRNKNKIKKLILNDKRFTIYEDPNNMIELMRKNSIGIFSFGVSIYEAAFAKLAVVTIAHSNENDISAKRIEKYGWFRHIGKYDKINYPNFPSLVDSIMSNKIILEKMKNSAKIIDGLGAKRIVNTLIKNKNKKQFSH
jgi:UDP-2,4-diacetamido-2,4,6-trideoxy-beta-L-altropyranose hydrolase